MFEVLIIFLLLIYFSSIIKNFFEVLKITSCIDTLEAFLQSTTPSYGGYLIGDNYKKSLNDVLAKYPDICEYTSYNSTSLGYDKSDYDNYNAATSIYQELFMMRNFLRKNFVKSFNPFSAVKKLIILPSTIINYMGFRAPTSFSKIFNVVAWIAAYFFNMYQEEIKAFINSLLKSL